MTSAGQLIRALLRSVVTALFVFVTATFVLFLLFGRSPVDKAPGVLLHSSVADAAEGSAKGGNPNYAAWLMRLITHGDLGHSEAMNRTVTAIVCGGLVVTLKLAVGSLIISAFIALLLGCSSALHPDSRTAKLLLGTMTMTSACPAFLLACFLLPVWAANFGMLDYSQADLWQEIRCYLIPVIILGIGDGAVGEMTKQVREAVNSVIGENYVRAARARGASLWKHIWKAMAVPIFGIAASRFSYALGGALIVEYIFFGNGLSASALDALRYKDSGVILGIGVAFCAMSITAELLHQILFMLTDPRTIRGDAR